MASLDATLGHLNQRIFNARLLSFNLGKLLNKIDCNLLNLSGMSLLYRITKRLLLQVSKLFLQDVQMLILAPWNSRLKMLKMGHSALLNHQNPPSHLPGSKRTGLWPDYSPDYMTKNTHYKPSVATPTAILFTYLCWSCWLYIRLKKYSLNCCLNHNLESRQA